ncbi:S-layer homology domain-containing protein [Paenibacillus nasutitermitis]|uniref:SLH domain-containing protein n=1 Tax=Paenibacillus nasutitermitis TaxID=1652958 RepID=A0A916ZM90_9BACL|nr:S-layer homology domain-containing protein [Paenibacillus nasutitermitis]GGE02809.1 hypothetical protein GCM10010911_72340 [Paenibacillus nasutitermitis]
MKVASKVFMLVLAILVSFCSVGPIQPVHAAQITSIYVIDEDANSVATHLVAGKLYSVSFNSDKAPSTRVERPWLDYSADNGATWLPIPISESVNGFRSYGAFRLPIDSQLVSIQLRYGVYFNPVIGSMSSSIRVMGPYKVLQPGDPSDFTATPNDDGTVTLRWEDRSNMESYYRISRSGPDGDKIFDVPGTKDHVGPLSFTDKKTNTSKSTIYVYSLTPVIDQFNLPEELIPGIVWATVKTKVPFQISDVYKELPILIPELNTPKDKPKPDPDTTINLNALKYLEKFNLKLGDLDKAAVSGVKLDKKAIALEEGASQTLIQSVTPSHADNRNVTWSSDNSQVAEVDSTGKVTGKSSGIAKITVKTEAGNFTDTCMVTVMGKAESPPQELQVIQLSDLAGHQARDEITKAVSSGIVSGYPDGTFRPDGSVTRAEFASMLMRGVKPADEGMALVFKDKDKIGSWAVESVQQAVKLGIISGYADGTFRPNANITHAEMIAMVVRASGLPMGEEQQTGLADDADIPKWAKPAVSKAEETGIIIVGGLPEGKFAPQALTTRAEAASAIVRMLGVRK